MEEYLLAKESIGWPSEEWLSWEQFAALGDFYSASWWPSTPASVEYEYLYTDFNTKNTWIYHVDFEKLREDSGVTNIKEYNQWYLGCEWDLTVESDSGLNRRLVVNTPTISSDSFSDSNLTNIDPNDSIFKNCKNQYGDVGYYVDNMIEFTYYKETDSVRKLQFVYNGWLISIHKRKKDDLKSAIDNTDCKILQKLVNANTYKEAIAELMDPTNQNLPKQPVDSETARQIKKGMTYSEIHEILRNPGEDIGSGAILYEWELDNGDVLHVWFQSSTELIAINVRIDQKS